MLAPSRNSYAVGFQGGLLSSRVPVQTSDDPQFEHSTASEASSLSNRVPGSWAFRNSVRLTMPHVRHHWALSSFGFPDDCFSDMGLRIHASGSACLSQSSVLTDRLRRCTSCKAARSHCKRSWDNCFMRRASTPLRRAAIHVPRLTTIRLAMVCQCLRVRCAQPNVNFLRLRKDRRHGLRMDRAHLCIRIRG